MICDARSKNQEGQSFKWPWRKGKELLPSRKKRRKSSRELKEYDQNFLLVVLLFVNQNAAILESSGNRDYENDSCRYTEHSCIQLLEDVLSAPLLQQKTTTHSVSETKSGL